MIKLQSYISEYDREYGIRLLKHWRSPYTVVFNWNRYRLLISLKAKK